MLNGDVGDDTLYGWYGNDTLNGGDGNDTYRFGRGEGAETISESDSTPGNVDVIEFKSGVAPGDVLARRVGTDLVLMISGTNASLRAQGYFSAQVTSGSVIEQVKFADGTIWNVATVKEMVTLPTASSEEIWGYDATTMCCQVAAATTLSSAKEAPMSSTATAVMIGCLAGTTAIRSMAVKAMTHSSANKTMT